MSRFKRVALCPTGLSGPAPVGTERLRQWPSGSSMVDEKSCSSRSSARVSTRRVSLALCEPFRRFVALQAAHRMTGPPAFSHGKGRQMRVHQRCPTTGEVSEWEVSRSLQPVKHGRIRGSERHYRSSS